MLSLEKIHKPAFQQLQYFLKKGQVSDLSRLSTIVPLKKEILILAFGIMDWIFVTAPVFAVRVCCILLFTGFKNGWDWDSILSPYLSKLNNQIIFFPILWQWVVKMYLVKTEPHVQLTTHNERNLNFFNFHLWYMWTLRHIIHKHRVFSVIWMTRSYISQTGCLWTFYNVIKSEVNSSSILIQLLIILWNILRLWLYCNC